MKDESNHIDDQLRESIGGFEQSPPKALWVSIRPDSKSITMASKPFIGLLKLAAAFTVAAGVSYTLHHFFSIDKVTQTIASDPQTHSQVADSQSLINEDLIPSNDQVLTEDSLFFTDQYNLTKSLENIADPITNHEIAIGVISDNAIKLIESINPKDEIPSHFGKENNTNEGVDSQVKSRFRSPIIQNLVSKSITPITKSIDKKRLLSISGIHPITSSITPTKSINKRFYVHINFQKLSLEKVDYRKDSYSDIKFRYKANYEHNMAYNNALLVGTNYNNELIIETGITRGNYYYTNIYRGELYSENKKENMGKHDYKVNFETANGSVDATVKLIPDPTIIDPKEKFATSISMNQELKSWGIPVRVGYVKSRNKWNFIAKGGLDFTFFKQSNLSFEVIDLSDKSYLLSTATINIPDVVPSAYKMTYGIQGHLGVEYKLIPHLGMQATIGASNELHKSTTGIPNRRWRRFSIGLKWYLNSAAHVINL